MSLDATIPVIDFADFQDADPEAKQRFVDGLGAALRSVGFVAVINPGVDVGALDAAYAAVQRFFMQPLSVKQRISGEHVNGQRGFVCSESAKGETTKDVKSFLHIGPELGADADAAAYAAVGLSPNIWPSCDVAGASDADVEAGGVPLKKAMMTLFDALASHSEPMQRAIALAIGRDEDSLTNMTTHRNYLLRALHYPATPPADSVWAAQHTDIGMFTVLPRATARGLQVRNGEGGEWLDVVVPDNAFVVNAGDMLQNMSNGECRSSEHRVVDNGSGEARFSMVMFMHPDTSQDVSPSDVAIARTGGKALYPTATQKSLLGERLADLGLATPSCLNMLAASGLIERSIKCARGPSRDAMSALRDAGLASAEVLAALAELEGK